MKKIYGVIAFLSFMFVIGTIGTVEVYDQLGHGLPFGEMCIRLILGMVILLLSAVKSGIFKGE